VQLLQAASLNYPDDLAVRRAVAGAYAKVGRATDALGLFKTIPMDDAGPLISGGDQRSAWGDGHDPGRGVAAAGTGEVSW